MAAEVTATITQDVEQVSARISDAFVILDREWRYTYVNDKLAELAGINKEDFLGKSTWYSSDLEKEPFNQQTIALGEELPGQIWASGQPVWISEPAQNENFFAAAIGFPIRLGNKILGVIEFVSDEISEPDTNLLQMMSAIATQIGQFIEQQRSSSLLQESEEKYRRIFETSGVSIGEENSLDNLKAQEVTDLRQYLGEQQQVEENLRHSEARYRSLAEASASIVWCAGPWGNVVDEIPTWEAFTGQSPEEYKEWGWVDALHPDDRTSVAAIWQQAFFGRSVAVAEYRVLRHDGEYRYMKIRGVPILDETGEIEEWVGMCVDISDVYDELRLRKQAEAEREQLLALLKTEQTRLVEANVLLDTLFNNAPIGIGLWDEKLRYVRLNDALAEINGFPQEVHIGKTVAQLLPGVDSAVMEAFQHVIETGESIAQEAGGETPAAPGKHRYWSVNYYPIKLPNDITWVGAICQEITERKQAEVEREQLFEREQAARVEAETAKEQVTKILESITDGFLAFDSEWRFTYLNHEGSRTLGRSCEDLLGKNLWSEFPELAGTSFGQLYQRAVDLGMPLELEDYYPPFDAWFTVRAYPSSTGLSLYFRNINVRKRAEAKLRESEACFRLLAENSTDIISRHTVDGTLLYVSPACYTVLGYQPEELVGHSSQELVHPDDLAEIAKNYPVNADLPDIYTISHRARHKDGHYIWLETTVRAIRDRQTKEIVEMQASSRDITERKQVEEEQRFLAEASGILAASLDYETTLASLTRLAVPKIADWCLVDIICDNQLVRRIAAAHANPEKQELVEQLQNYPPDLTRREGVAEVIRTGKSQIIHFISDEQMQAATQNTAHLKILQELNPTSGMSVPLIVRGKVLGAMNLVSSSGRRYDTKSLMLAEELACRAAVAVDNARLYTETEQSQQATLRAASRTARLQTITAALSESLTPAQVAEVIVEQGMAAMRASSALVALVTKSGTELEIIRTVGYQQEAVDLWRRFSINASVPLAEAVRNKQPIWQESTTARIARYSHLAKEYAQLDYGAWISIPLIIEGRAIGGMSLAFAEIQEFNQDDQAFMLALAQQCAQAMERARLYEAEQTAREAAENANRIKDEFLAVLSHELRSPLNPILGWSKLLQTKKLDEKTIPQALKTIERNATLQAQLIEDLLDISRILQGKLSLNIYPVDLTSVISAAMETVRLSAEAKSIEMHISLKPNLGQVLGDSSRLQQVVWNLLSNAVKFTPAGGRVDIRLSSCTNSNSNSALIQVSDTGKGIDPNFLPYVFEYFRQENSSTTRKFGGLGLGLAIVRHLVELHGGTVQVESGGEDQGATFTVRLPLIQNQLEIKQDSSNSETSSNLNGVNILVVDDDADTREFIAFLLEQYGANVTAVASAEKALAALSQSLPDILLSDIGMPEVDGCMFMRQLRTLPPEQGGQIRAIALTAYAGEMNAKQVLAAGFQKHLAKPVEPAELVDAIANLIAE